jgi:hypothetical protein
MCWGSLELMDYHGLIPVQIIIDLRHMRFIDLYNGVSSALNE